MIKIDIIAGARPNFIKIAPLIHEFQKTNKFEYRLIHTGQHYDKKMSDDFFSQLNIPHPNKNLAVGSGSQAEQTSGIMLGYEKYLETSYNPNLCVVVGDVTSTMACAIVAKKRQIKVAHIEAGIRSGDLKMPEEINRILTDSITDYFFTTTQSASDNLMKTGVNTKQIFFVGNIMIDTLKRNVNKFFAPAIWKEFQLFQKKYFVLTLHRPSNVDNSKNFFNILSEIDKGAINNYVIYPVHPRVREKLKSKNIKYQNIKFVEPIPYLEFNFLVKNAKAVITDSGGITEEATVYGIPCITLRKNTERPETVSIGTNILLKNFPNGFKEAVYKINNNTWKKGSIPEKWDGKTAKRIVKQLENIYK